MRNHSEKDKRGEQLTQKKIEMKNDRNIQDNGRKEWEKDVKIKIVEEEKGKGVNDGNDKIFGKEILNLTRCPKFLLKYN